MASNQTVVCKRLLEGNPTLLLRGELEGPEVVVTVPDAMAPTCRSCVACAVEGGGGGAPPQQTEHWALARKRGNARRPHGRAGSDDRRPFVGGRPGDRPAGRQPTKDEMSHGPAPHPHRGKSALHEALTQGLSEASEPPPPPPSPRCNFWVPLGPLPVIIA